jgi:hypothetical protein
VKKKRIVLVRNIRLGTIFLADPCMCVLKKWAQSKMSMSVDRGRAQAMEEGISGWQGKAPSTVF